MTELELHNFLDGDGVQYRWEGEELLVWIDFDNLDIFTSMVGYDYLSDGGLDCNLRYGCVCIDIVGICEYHNIGLESVFHKLGRL